MLSESRNNVLDHSEPSEDPRMRTDILRNCNLSPKKNAAGRITTQISNDSRRKSAIGLDYIHGVKPNMIPGELIPQAGTIELNAGREVTELSVANTGDRPIQVGSHFHFFEVNQALRFDRSVTRGQRLDIPAGTAVRFEPGDEKTVRLVPLVGERKVYGFNARVEGPLD